MKPLLESPALVSPSELRAVIDADLETIHNWIRRGIIQRAFLGRQNLRTRLFTIEEVYKTAFKSELVKLGIPPSSANDAVEEFWKGWDKKTDADKRRIYAVLFPTESRWTAELCWQEVSGGPLFKAGKSSAFVFPDRAFAMIPIYEVMARITERLSELLADAK
jgi:hypothetical protein